MTLANVALILPFSQKKQGKTKAVYFYPKENRYQHVFTDKGRELYKAEYQENVKLLTFLTKFPSVYMNFKRE